MRSLTPPRTLPSLSLFSLALLFLALAQSPATAAPLRERQTQTPTQWCNTQQATYGPVYPESSGGSWGKLTDTATRNTWTSYDCDSLLDSDSVICPNLVSAYGLTVVNKKVTSWGTMPSYTVVWKYWNNTECTDFLPASTTTRRITTTTLLAAATTTAKPATSTTALAATTTKAVTSTTAGLATPTTTATVQAASTTPAAKTSTTTRAAVTTTVAGQSTTSTVTKATTTTTATQTKTQSTTVVTTTKASTTLTSTTIRSTTASTSTTVRTTTTSTSTTVRTTTTLKQTTTALPSAKTFSLGHRVMIITVSGGAYEAAAILGLRSYGIPYDVFVGAPGAVVDGNGAPKYSLIVFTTQAAINALSAGQANTLTTYETTYSIRRVVLGGAPTSADGTSGTGSGVTESVTFAPAFAALAGLAGGATVDTSGLYHYPSTITNTAIATPVLYFGSAVGGVVVKPGAGREVMALYLDFGDWSTTSLLINHIWIQWGTRGVFQGNRRVVFQPQVDDLFLNTENYFNAAVTFRARPEDITALFAWQDDLNSRLPAGSSFKLEFAFNGNGILDKIASPLLIDIDTERHVDINYIKPLGTGTNRWPASFSTAWTSLASDPLFAFFTASDANQNRVNWLTHTFTHEDLNEATTYDVKNEIEVNVMMAQKLGLVGKAWWSGASIVTPAISGLFNGDVLAALTSHGIITAVGDNSRSNLVPSNRYVEWLSTPASSNYNGFHVIPRYPTEVYYTSDTVDQNVQIYNSIYAAQLGTSNWNQILAREAQRLVPVLLGLRHDPHMFHQANLRNSDQPTVTVGGKTGKLGILQQWVEYIVSKYLALVTWPMQGFKMDDLAQLYREREARESCGIATTFNVANGYLSSVTVSTGGSCKVGVTLPPGFSPGSGSWTTEKVGNDPVTVWVSMSAGGSTTIPLQGGFPWVTA
ncbi:hypothetical protein M427DRAFT_134956 [Gonapodya prolifera JEL478]|uniref:Uncharacterized protein n=1 Tax=Gonapodya prolifera (strain JEL478) TaxID=1344416 RepID=A0A139AFZ5_GONPJ|nr:hypothetical protein M427DRAFT_134956 [Gonapodya prolifera JEL478]|eukprot:KXS15716.1 hypothetical protein M427DRAFT_134956 [Gonapodya prolifera JEL478]